MTTTTEPRFRWLLLLMTFLIGVTCIGWVWLTFPMFIPRISDDLVVGAGRAQFLFGIISLSIVVTGVLGGTLGSRYSPKWTVGVGGLLVGVSAVSRWVPMGYSGMVGSSLCTGVGLGMIIPNVVQTLGLWFPPSEIGFANGVRMTGERAGAAVAQWILVGLLISYFNGWRPAQAVLGSVAILVALLWIVVYRNPTGSNAGATENDLKESRDVVLMDHLMESAKVLFSDRAMVVLGSMTFFHTYSFFAYVGLLPTWLLQLQFVPEQKVGTYNSLMFWALIVGGLAVPVLSDFIPTRKLLLIPVTTIMGLGIIGTGFSESLLVLAASILTTGLAAGGVFPLVFTLINERIDTASNSQSMEAGFILAVSQPGAVVGPSISGLVFEHYGVILSSLAAGGPILLTGVFLGAHSWIRNHG